MRYRECPVCKKVRDSKRQYKYNTDMCLYCRKKKIKEKKEKCKRLKENKKFLNELRLEGFSKLVRRKNEFHIK